MLSQRFTDSCCSFPTKVLLLDDDATLLSALDLALQKQFLLHTSIDPAECLQHLALQQKSDWLLKQCIENLQDSELDYDSTDNYLKLSMQPIQELIYNADRFNTYSVAIIDYDMPTMDGLTFCRQLGQTAVKKIMLTGRADHTLAVTAFNENLIDRFIMKDSKNLLEELINAIKELQQQYFIDISKALLQNIAFEEHGLQAATRVCLIKNQIPQYEDYSEFYLLDNLGSVLFLTPTGRTMLIAVNHTSDLDTFYHIALDNDAAADVISALESKQKMLVLPFTNTYDVPVSDWQDYLYPATQHHVATEYYYSIITGPIDKLLPSAKHVAFFSQYLDEKK